MDHLHFELLRDMAEWARRHGERVPLDHSVLTALLDAIDDWSVLAAQLGVKLEEIAAVEAPPAAAHVQRSKEHAWERETAIDIPSVLEVLDEPPAFVCPECGKDTFGSARGLAVHLRLVHNLPNDTPPALVCLICGKDGFKDARGLGGHIWAKHHIRASEMKNS